MKILKASELKEGAKLLKNNGLIAFPTETVYGLGVVYDDKEAYDRLVAVKRRPPEKPFTLMLADVEDIDKYAELNDISRALIKAFMPGQFTLITVAKPGLPEWCVSKIGHIGIRIADYDLIRNLIRETGKPLLVPSANRSGELPAHTSKEVVDIFGDELDAVIEGKSVSNIPSTIVLVENDYTHVLRDGVITVDQIKEVIQKEKNK